MGRFRSLLFIAAAVVIGLWILSGFWANIFVEALWFGQLGFDDVFWTTIGAKFFTGLVFGLVAVVGLGANVYLARYFSTRLTELHLFNEEMSELEQLFSNSRLIEVVTIIGILVIAAIMGLIGLANWDGMLRFFNQEAFGATDPIFNLDIGFFVFSLPIWHFVRFWLLLLVVASAIAVTLYYLYRGAVTIEERGIQIRSYARNHICVLGAIVFLLMAWGYRLDMYRLLFSESGFAFGAGYTDLHARMHALWILLFVAIACAGLFLMTLRSQRRNLPFIAIGGMIVSSLVVGSVYPGLVQYFVVAPNEYDREAPYIQHSIDYTLRGYGLDSVDEVPFQIQENLSAGDIQNNITTINNLKIQDKRPLRRTYQQLQEIRTYYDFSNVDEDRYIIDGEYRQVMLAARELSYAQLPSPTWQNRHLFYTHGYGLCLSPVNTATPEGLPDLFVKDIPPVSVSDDLTIRRPELYFGENMDAYAVVKTTQEEFDYPEGDENKFSRYQDDGGVELSSYFRRLAFARYFSEVNFVISPLITDESQVMFYRQLQSRMENIAPFLDYDHDPYLIIADGKLYWMIDAYTTTGSYPYSQRFSGLLQMPDQGDLGTGPQSDIPGLNQPPQRRFVQNQPTLQNINYIRNSVKVVIDAYSGETDFYLVDEEDPMVLTYQKIFPTLFRPLSEMPQTLRDHIRYPRDLFAIQAAMYRIYHMRNPQVFYNKEDMWAVPQQVYAEQEQQVYPYYAVMKTALMEKEEMLLLLPFTPANKENMIGWMAAHCDAPLYGRIKVYNFPKQELVYGPMQIEARITQDADIAKELTLWNQEGSQVIRGDIIVVPIQESLLYIEPLYLRQRSTRGGLPELKRVIVAYGNRIAMRETLDQALSAIFAFDGATLALETTQTSDGQIVPQPRSVTLNDLARRAVSHFDEAQGHLQAGDWSEYGASLQQLENVLRRLSDEAAQLE